MAQALSQTPAIDLIYISNGLRIAIERDANG
jgi:hypothetical protein